MPMPEQMHEEAPGQAPEPQDMGQGQGSNGGVQDLIVGIHNNLLKFKELLGSVQSIPDQVKMQLDKVVEDYKGFVAGLAGAAQGKPMEQPQATQESAPMAAPKQMPPSKMPVSGGKGAVPAL